MTLTLTLHFTRSIMSRCHCNMYRCYKLKVVNELIIQHQAVAFMLAEMAMNIELARLGVYRSAWDFDRGVRNTYYASIGKGFAADMANKCAADCVQVTSP